MKMLPIFSVLETDTEEMSFWEEIGASISNSWRTMYRGFTSVNPDKNGSISVFWIVVGLCIGIVAASWAITLQRRLFGKFVRQVLKQDVDAPEKAKTLADMSLDTPINRFAVTHVYEIKDGIRSVEAEQALSLWAGANNEKQPAKETVQASENDGSSAESSAEATTSTLQDVTETKDEPQQISQTKARNSFFRKAVKPSFVLNRNTIGEAHFYVSDKKRFLLEEHFTEKNGRLLTPILITIGMWMVCCLILRWLPSLLDVVETVL